jgi:uncharacterized membrane protein required for colicin V production
MLLLAGLPAFLKGASFNYFDIIVIGWLLVGFARGRSHGMTRELLPTIQWVLIVVLAGLFYSPLSSLIYQGTSHAFNRLWSNITAYVLIGFAIHLFFLWIKQGVGDKLAGSDYFGRAEYYLGMTAGFLRFAAILIVMCALMHSRIYTQAELAEDEKVQKKNFEDIRFPTYMSVQHTILLESITGRLMEKGLHPVLIVSTTGSKASTETLGQRRDDALNAILGPTKK